VGKLNLYYGTVKSTTGGRHIMAWANSREHALDLVEAALTAAEPVLGSVVGPLMSLPDDVMKPGVFVEAKPAPEDLPDGGQAAPGWVISWRVGNHAPVRGELFFLAACWGSGAATGSPMRASR